MSELKHINGRYCEFNQEDWEEHKEQIRTMSENQRKSSEILDRLLTEIMPVLLGKEIVPADVARSLLAEQRNSYNLVIKALSWCFGIIIIVLLGVKYLAPHLFNGA